MPAGSNRERFQYLTSVRSSRHGHNIQSRSLDRLSVSSQRFVVLPQGVPVPCTPHQAGAVPRGHLENK